MRNSNQYTYEYIIGRGSARIHRVSPPLSSRYALYRYIREMYSVVSVRNMVRIVSRKVYVQPAFDPTPILVKADENLTLSFTDGY